MITLPLRLPNPLMQALKEMAKEDEDIINQFIIIAIEEKLSAMKANALMKETSSRQLTPEQQAELDALSALPDEEIDTQDVPEMVDWSGAQRGLFYRPIEQ